MKLKEKKTRATALFIISPSRSDQRLGGHLDPERDQRGEAERGDPLRLGALHLLLEPLCLGHLALHHNLRDIRSFSSLLNSKTTDISLL